MKRIIFLMAVLAAGCFGLAAQNPDWKQEYEEFRRQIKEEYDSFRDRCNREYAAFLREGWEEHSANAPEPIPDDNIIPPRPFIDEDPLPDNRKPVTVTPTPLPKPQPVVHPEPIEPVREEPLSQENYFSIDFYELPCRVRLPKSARNCLATASDNTLSDAWLRLSGKEMNNALLDCLEIRKKNNLSDWAYLLFLDNLTRRYCDNANSATLLMAYLLCQSGYQIRLAFDGNNLVMLFGSQHSIYNRRYFILDNLKFYPYNAKSERLRISSARFNGETPLSLIIDKEQRLGTKLTQPRKITSKKYPGLEIWSQVPVSLISFYDTYPFSQLGSNEMTSWASYANVPLAQATKEAIYPKLKKEIEGLSELEAVNKLLNLVQTGFEYDVDDNVWGHERSFFSEETLYYPYSDCEDRAILFSRLVRDLTGLDVALIEYPGHLATAVAFNEDVRGDAMRINGRTFIVCDPTYINASAGMQMRHLDCSNTKAILLNR